MMSDITISQGKPESRLQSLYRLLQTTHYLHEGLDGTIRAIELAIIYYKSNIPTSHHVNGDDVIRKLLYRQEVFRSTLLRVIVLRSRLDTINTLVSWDQVNTKAR